MQQQPLANDNNHSGLRRQFIAQQQTLPQPVVPFASPLSPVVPPSSNMPNLQQPVSLTDPVPLTSPSKKKLIARIIAVSLVIGLIGAIYGVWHSATPTTTTTTTASSSADVTQQNFSTSSTAVSTTDGIRVYVVGAVKHPGIYTLSSGARVYDLIQAAGGTLPSANLVAINLAAKLSDGQEVYITQVGETPPTYTSGVSSTTSSSTPGVGSGSNSNGQLVNINTASVDELSQSLHISKKSAQTIVDYRTQHGDFSNVDSLAQVVSRTIYNKIKAQCTV